MTPSSEDKPSVKSLLDQIGLIDNRDLSLLSQVVFDDEMGAEVLSGCPVEEYSTKWQPYAKALYAHFSKHGAAGGERLYDALDPLIDEHPHKADRERLSSDVHDFVRLMQDHYQDMPRDRVRELVSGKKAANRRQQLALKLSKNLTDEASFHSAIQEYMISAHSDTPYDEFIPAQDKERWYEYQLHRDALLNNPIKPLHDRGVRPVVGGLFGIQAPPKVGKTSLKRDFVRANQEYNVLAVTLEEEIHEYTQSLVQADIGAVRSTAEGLTEDGHGRSSGYTDLEREVWVSGTDTINMDNENQFDEVKKRFGSFEENYNNLRIVRFPSGVMRVAEHLAPLLLGWKAQDGWVPKMILVDYLGEMDVSSQDGLTVGMGKAVTDLKTLAAGGYTGDTYAVVTSLQVNRGGIGKETIDETNSGWTLAASQKSTFFLSLTQTTKMLEDGVVNVTVTAGRRGAKGLKVKVATDTDRGVFCKSAKLITKNDTEETEVGRDSRYGF